MWSAIVLSRHTPWHWQDWDTVCRCHACHLHWQHLGIRFGWYDKRWCWILLFQVLQHWDSWPCWREGLDVAGPSKNLDIDMTETPWLIADVKQWFKLTICTYPWLDDMARGCVGFRDFWSHPLMQLHHWGSWPCWSKWWMWSDVAGPGIHLDINMTEILVCRKSSWPSALT